MYLGVTTLKVCTVCSHCRHIDSSQSEFT